MKKNRVKLCFVSHLGSGAGGERSLLEVVASLHGPRFQCFVILPREGLLADELRALGVEYGVVPFKFWMSVRRNPVRVALKTAFNSIALFRIVRQIRKWGCQLVFTSTITHPVAALAGKIARVAHLWSIMEYVFLNTRLKFDYGDRISKKFMDWTSSAIMVNSRALWDFYRGDFSEEKMALVYNLIRVDPALLGEDFPSPWKSEGSFKCVVVGSFTLGKRQEDAVRAIGVLAERGVDVELAMVGGGEEDYRARVERLVGERGLQNRVHLFREVKNPFPLVNGADVLVTCSEFEAFSRVPIEAMLLGKPVIGARSGGTVEQIEDGVTGLFFAPRDHVELADKIQYLAERPNVAAEMGRRGREWAEKTFTSRRATRAANLRAMVRAWRNFYSGTR
ncbi:MAG: glycosyltransferase family 4 protein [Promethearchaeota archaeon]